MDTVLNRQKRSLVVDALYAAVVVAGLLVYLFGLGSSRAVARPLPAPAVQPAPVEAGHTADCTPATDTWRC